MSLERIVRGRSATLYKTFYSDGVAADPTGAPTVTVTRVSDGTAVTTGAVTDEVATGTWSVTIPATSNLLLDTYTVDWAAVVNSVSQEYIDTVEVAGDVFFTIAEARRLKPLDSTSVYPTDRIVEMRTIVEQAIEDECGVAFVPRYRLETIDGTGTSELLLMPRTTSIRSATVTDTALTAGDLAELTYMGTGVVYGYTWTLGSGNVTVGYEHGHPRPPERIKRAALLLARAWLVAGPVDDRASTFSSADGGTYGLVVPGRGGSIFGLPEVDAAVQQYSLRAGVA